MGRGAPGPEARGRPHGFLGERPRGPPYLGQDVFHWWDGGVLGVLEQPALARRAQGVGALWLGPRRGWVHFELLLPARLSLLVLRGRVQEAFAGTIHSSPAQGTLWHRGSPGPCV